MFVVVLCLSVHRMGGGGGGGFHLGGQNFAQFSVICHHTYVRMYMHTHHPFNIMYLSTYMCVCLYTCTCMYVHVGIQEH